jgi:long-chain fatty acid transport protein
MSRLIRRWAVAAGAAALAGVVWSPDAAAAGFAAAHYGGEHGNVVESNPLALYYNPAGIAFSEGITLYIDGNLAARHATWFHNAAPPSPGGQANEAVGNTGEATALNVFGGPALGATMKVGNFAVGAGLLAPFAGRVNWSQNNQFQNTYNPPAGEPVSCDKVAAGCTLAIDGVQRWHMITGSLTFTYGMIGLAYKLGPLALGATANLVISNVNETQAHSTNGDGLASSPFENRVTVDVSGINASFGLGAMLEAIPDKLWIGASYQAQPGLGPQKLSGTLNYSSNPTPYYGGNDPTHYDIYFHQALPDIFRGGIRFRPTDDLEFRAFGDLTRWSVMKSQCINDSRFGDACLTNPDGSDATPQYSVLANLRRNWNDTYGGRFGASYWLKPEVELFAGVGYETGASPGQTIEPGTMDGDNVLGSFGGRFFLADSFYLSASYTHIQFFTRDVATSQLSCAPTVSPSTQSDCIPGQGLDGTSKIAYPTYQQDGNGHYTQWIGILDVNVEKRF